MAASLDLIPVLDLMSGHVVRARAGRRDEYRPIASALCPSSDPLDVVSRLLGLYPFGTLYVADLDAILGRGDHMPVLESIRAHWPDLTLWVDAGFRDPASARAWRTRGLGRPVLGSESLATVPAPGALSDGAILSLDFRGETFVGPDGLLAAPDIWSDEVIAMTLGRVGTAAGPDFARLHDLMARAPKVRVYAAGGVRHLGDLAELTRIGVAGVLLASALHDGILGRSELRACHDGCVQAGMAGARATGRDRDR